MINNKILNTLNELKNIHAQALISLGKLIAELEQGKEYMPSTLNDLLSEFEGHTYGSNKKRSYPCYKRPESVPDPMKGEDLFALLQQAQELGVFKDIGLNDDPSDLEKVLIEEAKILKAYVKAMFNEGKQFYLLKPQKALLEKYEDNKIFTENINSENFINFKNWFYKVLLETRSKIEEGVTMENLGNGLTESVFLAAFRRCRVDMPTMAVDYTVLNNGIKAYGKKIVNGFYIARTRSELSRITRTYSSM